MSCSIHLADGLNNARGHQKTEAGQGSRFLVPLILLQNITTSCPPPFFFGLTSHSLFSQTCFLLSFHCKEEDDLSELEFGKQ